MDIRSEVLAILRFHTPSLMFSIIMFESAFDFSASVIVRWVDRIISYRVYIPVYSGPTNARSQSCVGVSNICGHLITKMSPGVGSAWKYNIYDMCFRACGSS